MMVFIVNVRNADVFTELRISNREGLIMLPIGIGLKIIGWNIIVVTRARTGNISEKWIGFADRG